MSDEQKEKWKNEFNIIWKYFEIEDGHIKSPANKYSFKSYIAAKKSSQIEYESILKLLHERDCYAEELEYKLALAKEALEKIRIIGEPFSLIYSTEVLEKLK